VKFACMHNGERLVDACKEPHEFSTRELSEYTRVIVDLQQMPSDYSVEVASGIVCLASEISEELVGAQP